MQSDIITVYKIKLLCDQCLEINVLEICFIIAMKVGRKVGVLSRIKNKLNLEQQLLIYKYRLWNHILLIALLIFQHLNISMNVRTHLFFFSYDLIINDQNQQILTWMVEAFTHVLYNNCAETVAWLLFILGHRSHFCYRSCSVYLSNRIQTISIYCTECAQFLHNYFTIYLSAWKRPL